MSKTTLSIDIPDGQPSYIRLLPIIEYCLANDCVLERGTLARPFSSNKNHDVCGIIGTITLDDIVSEFALSDEIVVGVPYDNSLWDKFSNSVITFNPSAE